MRVTYSSKPEANPKFAELSVGDLFTARHGGVFVKINGKFGLVIEPADQTSAGHKGTQWQWDPSANVRPIKELVVIT